MTFFINSFSNMRELAKRAPERTVRFVLDAKIAAAHDKEVRVRISAYSWMNAPKLEYAIR